MLSRSLNLWLIGVFCVVCVVQVWALKPVQAGGTLAVSLGYGYQVSPKQHPDRLNLLVAPGYALLADILRLELGFGGELKTAGAGKLQDFGLRLRPMVLLQPPILPVYLRGTLAVLELDKDYNNGFLERYGLALGMKLALLGAGIFTELGFLSEKWQNTNYLSLEGRAGVFYAF